MRLKKGRDQLPMPKMVGLGGLEPPTSRLSGVRSNQLSYRPRRKPRFLPYTLPKVKDPKFQKQADYMRINMSCAMSHKLKPVTPAANKTNGNR